jgi:hypothetical protein
VDHCSSGVLEFCFFGLLARNAADDGRQREHSTSRLRQFTSCSGTVDGTSTPSDNPDSFVKVAREGEPTAGVSGAEYTGFSDPLVNSNLDVAFIGTIKGGNVNSRMKTGIWFGSTRLLGDLTVKKFTVPPADPPDPSASPRSLNISRSVSVLVNFSDKSTDFLYISSAASRLPFAHLAR